MFLPGTILSDSRLESYEVEQPTIGLEILFSSSNENAEEVNIISQNSDSFSQLVLKYGFNLHFQTDEKQLVSIRLIQSSDVCNWRKAFSEMENMLKSHFSKIKKVENNKPPLCVNKSSAYANIHSFLEDLEKLMEHTQKTQALEKKVQLVKMAEQRFISDTSMSSFTMDTTILNNICDRLGVEKDGINPFQHLRSIAERRDAVTYFIKLLQTKIKKNKRVTLVQQKMLHWFKATAPDLYFTPTPDQILKKTTRNKNILKLDDIVGTVHYMKYKVQDVGIVWLSMAIFDWKVVASAEGATTKEALVGLYNALKEKRQSSENYKFLVDCNYKDEYSDFFTPLYNISVYDKNEKVVTWIKNNMTFTSHTHVSLMCIVAMYNLFYSCYTMFEHHHQY